MDEIILISDADIQFLEDRLANQMPEVFADMLSHARVDADVYAVGSGYFFKRELQYIYKRALEAKIPAPNAMMFFPAESEVSRGADSYTQYIEEPLGEAAIISNFANDLPRVNVTQRQQTKSVHWLGDEYAFSVKDIAASVYANKPLNRSLGIAARRIIERKHNRLAWFGDVEADLSGILNNPDIPHHIFSNAFNSGTTEATIEDEILSAVNSIRTLTKTTSRITDIALPPAEYAYIHSTSRSQDSNTTMAAYILLNNPWLERIHEAWELDADVSENGGNAFMFGWNRDPDGLRYEMIVPFEQQPVERNGLEFVVKNIGITGGINIRRPLEAFIGELVR